MEREVALLGIDHPRGFAIRLRVLGDFYSVEYVELWHRLLTRHPALHVFGFTARHDHNDPIAAALIALVRDYPDFNRAFVPEAKGRDHLPRANWPDRILQHVRLVLGDYQARCLIAALVAPTDSLSPAIIPQIDGTQL